jgi:phenylalanyl-tRNA synthetase beta chain
MLVSLKWLRDYVDCSLPPEEIAEKLTMAGLEVESVSPAGPDFSGVVVARIESVNPHPNADRLSLCEVTTGDKGYRVVCGAQNIGAGDVVPLARVGAVIPGGYTIRHSTIRGEASEGMLCSEEELGIGNDATGIMQLDRSLPLGEDLQRALDLEDVVLDVAVTPNRPDCLSMLGIAREVALLTGADLRYPDSSCDEAGEDIHGTTSVEIQSPRLCPRYTARLVRNVHVGSSPSWMRVRLEAVGLRSINNVVDVTNFVMMEYGQPLHAFDFSFLEEGRIVVRGASEGEEFQSLDEKVHTLAKDTLMICDGIKPVAIAGIMGGLNSEVRDATDTILLESAYFNPTSIRKAARTMGMSTDAAFRFERGVDPGGVIPALNRAARLMAELSGGSVAKGHIDEYPREIVPPAAITLRIKKAEEILGLSLDASRIQQVLRHLEMTVHDEGDGILRVTPPTFRGDVTREIDLVEEIARIEGYDTIPVTLPPLAPPSAEDDDRDEQIDSVIKNALTGLGYMEVIHYSFTSPESSRLLGFPESHESWKFVTIENPLTEDTSVMRTNLVYGLLGSMRRNMNAGNSDLKFFEAGKIFIRTETGKLPRETKRIAGLLTGARFERSWRFQEETSDFYDMKGCLETLFEALSIEAVRFDPDPTVPFLHPGRSASVFFGNNRAGVVGEVHPDVLARMDLPQTAFVFELDQDALINAASLRRRFREIPRFPAVARDVAFLVDRNITADQLCSPILNAGEELLESVHVFDVYCGSSVPKDMKSLALRFTYRSPSKTLADSDVGDVHHRIVDEIIRASGAKVRGMD